MYYLRRGNTYIGLDKNKVPTTVSILEKALSFNQRKKAENYRDNLKSTLRKFEWEIYEESKIEAIDVTEKKSDCEFSEEFDISDFFVKTITTVSQLADYTEQMRSKELNYNDQILDVRHYLRDDRNKLNAVQMQKLGCFLRALEKERHECKSNRLIAEIFLDDLNQLKDKAYIQKVKMVKESIYKPRALSFEIIDEIVGRKPKVCTITEAEVV